MTQFRLTRLTGAALTIGGIALASFINSEIPDKTLLHLSVIGVAAFVSVIGIGIFEDASRDGPVLQDDASADISLSPSRKAA